MNAFLTLIAIIVVVGYIWYVIVIKRRNTVLEALGGVDVQLTLRHNLIPNVLEIARAFMEHERALMNEITELRTQAQEGVGSRSSEDVAKHLGLENLLSAKMGQFYAVAENYPQLRSSEAMIQAQREYSNVEQNIAAARRFYNSAVTSLNNALQIPPGNWVGIMAGVSPFPYYEAPDESRAPVDAGSFFRPNP